MIPRFFCPFPLNPGAAVQLPDDTAHHALRVLRVAEGDAAVLFDGHGGQWTATLHPAGKGLRATLHNFNAEDHEPPLAITLAQCLPAADKMDYVVQKAVELGVSVIQPVAAKRSVIRLSGERMERRLAHWRSIAIAACEQCGRNRVPEIAPILDLPQYLAQASAHNQTRWICLPPEQGAALPLRERPAPGPALTLLVGPEAGYEESEIKASAAAGFVRVQMGPRILRSETAGPAALAAVLSLWGDI